MPMDPEVLYRELGQLVAEIPGDFSGSAPISAETHRWLGRAAPLIAETVGLSGDRHNGIYQPLRGYP